MANNVENIIEALAEAAEVHFGGDVRPNVYTKMRDISGYEYKPRYLYFYYVRLTSDKRLEVRHYEFLNEDENGDPKGIKFDEVKGIVTALFKNTRETNANPAPLPEINFNNVSWRRRSYIAILFDEPYWRLFKKGRSNPPIVFLNRKKGDRIGMSNHTFFDGQDLDIKYTPPGEEEAITRTAFAFINHHKRHDDGERIRNTDDQFFFFNIYLDIAFSTGNDPDLTLIFDPGGTNQGPSLNP